MNLLFWCAAAGMTVMAWLLLVVPLRSRGVEASHPASPGAASLLVLQQALLDLNAEFAAGRIDAMERDRCRREIEQRVLADVAGHKSSVLSRPSRTSIAGLGLAIVVFAFAVYGYLGKPSALQPSRMDAASTAAAQEAEARAAESMLDSMEQKMQGQRAGTVDAAGWALVARSYAALNRFDKASSAFARALSVAPDDPVLLVDQADVLAMLQGGSTRGEPARLIQRALGIQPRHPKALALAGSDAFERHDFAAAIDFWTRAREQVPTGAFAANMDAQLQAARAAMGSGQ
ncbi:c-type cytochrome biogenesis protein CcmI [Variovorax sp. J22R133]|uniref:c-type cytochrome biogenesis protein CcmI n=1 Tax=Variovorax brevis TaxID=3053503 RepID=UPI0025780B24|nr:c-type cytochrome biogenesis protein CcmI [Variovorax sp. J22R133]MDM0113776.1 c-type cytochrome biogenesis protein CcmI [Variovorax sp. J22R133]